MAGPRATTSNWRAILAWIACGSLLAFLMGFGNTSVMYASALTGLVALWLLCVIFVIDCIVKLIGRH